MYPQIDDAVLQILPLINQLHELTKTNTNQNRTFELEARFGTFQIEKNHFQAGVSQPFLEKILQKMHSCTEWLEVRDWNESQDFFYSVCLNDGVKQVRSSCFFLDDDSKKEKEIKQVHTMKMVIDKVDLSYIKSTTFDHDSKYDIRVSLSEETQIDQNQLPQTVIPDSVRIKQRKSFIYGNQEAKLKLWRFDFTISWTGNSKEEAEKKQQSCPPTFELECECLNPAFYFETKKDDIYLATSLLLKVRDFLGTDQYKLKNLNDHLTIL